MGFTQSLLSDNVHFWEQPLNVSVCWLGEKTCITVTAGVKSQLSSQPNWSLSKVGVTAVTAHERSSSQHTNSQLQRIHQTWNAAQKKQSTDATNCGTRAHANWSRAFTHRFNKLKFFPLLNLKTDLNGIRSSDFTHIIIFLGSFEAPTNSYFLDQTNVFKGSSGKVSLLHLQGCIRLHKHNSMTSIIPSQA